jgi:3',5'-cyclic-nucleotide phosphodiesterase
MGLDFNEKALRKFTAFATVIENGYPETNYHCRMHAADVTSRYAAILVKVGIASANSTTHHRRGMTAALVAAAIHDYEHPGVSNVFMVEQVRALSRGTNKDNLFSNIFL